MNPGSYNFFILGEVETRLTVDKLKVLEVVKLEEVYFRMIEAAF